MPEKYQQIIENKKIGNLSFEAIEEDIESDLKYLGVDIAKFQHPLPELIKKLVRFLGEYEIKYTIFSSYDRVLKGLCLMDSWISIIKEGNKEKIQKLKSVIDRFKVLCMVWNDETNKYRQLSKKVINQSENGVQKAKLFNPNIETVNDYRQLVNNTISNILKNYVDDDRSKFINKYILDIFPQLRQLVQGLPAYKESSDFPFKIKVLKLSTHELVNFPLNNSMRLGWSAIFSSNSKTGTADICLCYDSLTFESDAEHEIIHALSKDTGRGIMEGYEGMLGRGSNEALTENRNSKNLSYPQQRYVLDQILKDKPDLEKLAYETYFGSEPRDKLTAAIFNIYGSEGVIKFDFMASTSLERNDKIGKSILFDTKECLEFFSKGLEDPYLLALSKTRELEKKFDEISDILDKVIAEKPDEKTQWWKNYGIHANRISACLSLIDNYNNNVPLRDLFNDQKMLDNYNKLLFRLDEFSFVEDHNTQKDLARLAEATKNWQKFAQTQMRDYWLKYNKPSLFDRQPKVRSISKITAKQLENAWLASELMQNRKVN